VPNAYQILEWRKNPNTLVIGGGDYFGAGSLSGVDKGKLMLEVLYDMEMSVSAIGNHEFDEGVGSALTLFSESKDKI
jgi:2',3'-cyclic-nucleotide 2'-phosphodiesterase (5'-nucleotidase family)